MDQYRPALWRLVQSYVEDTAAGDDLFQEIALAVWQALPRFRGESSERTWLYRIAHNIAISTLASRRRRRSRETDLEDAAPVHAADESPEGTLLHKERRDAMLAAIRRLPGADRQLIVLHLEGLSYQEIEQIAGLSVSAIATRLSRIRSRLSDWVAGKEIPK